MDHVELSTIVYVPPDEAYEFLVDFEGYANYSKHLSGVSRLGDGGPGTEYNIHLHWWKLSYTVRSQVTSMEPPTRIDWTIRKDLDAHGYWKLEPVPEEAPPDREAATRVWLHIQFDGDSANSGMLNLPRFISLDWVVRRVEPLVLTEAERVVQRIVADLEGESRPVELTIHEDAGVLDGD